MNQQHESLESLITGEDEVYSDSENCEEYLERLDTMMDSYFIVNNVKKCKTLISWIGHEITLKMRQIIFPRRIMDVPYEEMTNIVRCNFTQEMSQRNLLLKFCERVQGDGESILNFALCLKSLARGCKFNSCLDQMLRDRFVNGLRNREIKNKILADGDKKFYQVLQKAMILEDFDKNCNIDGIDTRMTQL
ncbi:hypothetical protein DMENIID0001_010750 [Sergentomyia squamirostris]